MGFVQRFERKLEDAVGDAFARVFGGKVVPAEVQSSLQREAGDKLRRLEGGHRLAPNLYVITVGESDQQQLASDREMTTGALARQLRGYIADQGWETYGNVRVEFEVSPTLHTGQFRTAGSVDPDAGSARAQRGAQAARISPPGAGQMTQEPGNDRGRGATPGNQARADQPYGEDSYGDEVGYNGAYQQDAAYGDPRYAQQQGYPGGGAQQQSYGYQGQGHADQGYGAQAYGQGYAGQAYGEQSYADQGYADQGYADPNYGGAGYGDPRYAQQGYAGDYGAQGYGTDYPDQASATQNYGSYAQQGNWGALNAVLQLEDGSGRTYQLREGSNVIGRGQEAQFRLPDTGVSRRHADIRWDGQVALLTDLGSTNGTTVNGAPVQDWQLAEGDVVSVGHSEIVIHFR
ncbi:DUF3662 and FHA domain-containing protein [Rhodococcus sp. D2-41]|uniref:DUF3662 and FHA domain-containing protein n=1 Tax=Speluncibacter jeojiensis TaxID=2710754 RepID=UPI00241008D9|nr:DUF3662 and FHA domain-containing protein [Rhodococcus sp. D2-41]MDG3012887.1 DUF3662 and FHA domain-containing protein [Rhodococcus sp. D2-41]